MRHHSWKRGWAVLAALAVSGVAGTLHAQACGSRRPMRPWLGIGRFDCTSGVCRVLGAVAWAGGTSGDGKPTGPYRYDLSVEPSLWEIDPDGPAARRLEPGDVLVAVNGRAVTSVAASRILERLEVGTAVVLLVRRGPRQVEVSLTPVASCVGVWVSSGLTQDRAVRSVAVLERSRAALDSSRAVIERSRAVTDQMRERLEAGVRGHPADGRISSETVPRPGPGYLGVAIRCSRCELRLGTERAGATFRFEDFPEVVGIADGSLADRAGLLPGDLITHLDGHDIRTDAGAQRLAGFGLRPGDRVTIGYVRDGRAVTVEVGR